MTYNLDHLDAPTVKLLVDNGIQLDWYTILSQAIQHSDLDMIQYLLDRGVVPIPDHTKTSTLLHLACRWNDVECVKLLLRYPFDVNARDCNGDTPLHETDHDTIVRVLLEAGADWKIVNGAGQTALDKFRAIRARGDDHHDVIYIIDNSINLITSYDEFSGVKSALDE